MGELEPGERSDVREAEGERKIDRIGRRDYGKDLKPVARGCVVKSVKSETLVCL